MKHPPEIERARRLRRTQSVAEKLLWERLRRNQVNKRGVRRQAPVAGFVVDFLCYKPALIVEVDRPTHDDEEQKIFDVNRTRVLEAEGFLVVRVGERVVRDGIDHAVDWIARVGEMVLAKQIVSVELRRLDTVPLP